MMCFWSSLASQKYLFDIGFVIYNKLAPQIRVIASNICVNKENVAAK